MDLLNTVASLQKESQDALSIFEKTITRLNNINEKIAKMTATKVGKAAKLSQEIESLDTALAKNDKLAKKLEAFIAD